MISYGTGEAVTRLVGTYGDMLLRLASSRLRHPADAEDAVQEYSYISWSITLLSRAKNTKKRG